MGQQNERQEKTEQNIEDSARRKTRGREKALRARKGGAGGGGEAKRRVSDLPCQLQAVIEFGP